MDETTGLTSDFPQDEIDSGSLGDGSTDTQDWFTQLLNSKAAQSVATAATTAIVGGQKVVQNSDGTIQKLPGSQQGGTIGTQNKTAPAWVHNVPWWGWVIAGVLGILGLGALVKR